MSHNGPKDTHWSLMSLMIPNTTILHQWTHWLNFAFFLPFTNKQYIIRKSLDCTNPTQSIFFLFLFPYFFVSLCLSLEEKEVVVVVEEEDDQNNEEDDDYIDDDEDLTADI